jgi:hypothetical protein
VCGSLKKRDTDVFRKLWLLSFLIAVLDLNAQVYSDADVAITNSRFKYLSDQNLTGAPLPEIIVAAGKSFINTDYIESSLEQDGPEKLVINLSGFDCSTFLENVLAVSRSFKTGEMSFEGYYSELLKIRYRDGILAGYTSRLHYFSDWIYDNSRKNIIADVTKETGGEPISLNLNFMSANHSRYKHLEENPGSIPLIEELEKEINKRSYYFIPKDKVDETEEKILNGDILAFTSGIEGLDIGHVGIAVKENNRIYLLHANKDEGKVCITKEPLREYIRNINKHSGLIILRAVEPGVI